MTREQRSLMRAAEFLRDWRVAHVGLRALPTLHDELSNLELEKLAIRFGPTAPPESVHPTPDDPAQFLDLAGGPISS